MHVLIRLCCTTAGQAAFGNMVRGGHMYSPTKIWRRWHRRVAVNQRRYAVVSAVAASAVPALVMARGHRVAAVPEIPLVLADAVESLTKTKQAREVLKQVGALADVERVEHSKRLRAGKGKMRNRRFTSRKGPLVVYGTDSGIVRAFRNIPGVELADVRSLNLLKLAPGGHLGRFIIWTRSAFAALDEVFGTTESESEQKKGYKLPRHIMTNGDLTRLISSDEIQSVAKPRKAAPRRFTLKKNPLKNLGVMLKLNPYAAVLRREEARRTAAPKKVGKRASGTKATSRAFYKTMVADSDYQGEDYEVFSAWLGAEQ